MTTHRTIGSYRLLSMLGSGASGQVWQAQSADGDVVAVKLLRPDLADNPRIVQGFVGERTLLERVRGPYVTAVRDLIAEGGELGIVMDLVPAGSLRGLLDRGGTLPPGSACDLGSKIALGVAGLHEAGVIHRDIKPENVLLESASAPWSPRITDFGIAKVIEAGGTSSQRNTALVGTPAYIAPELFEGAHPSAASDIYSLGVMLYELCCAVTPFAHPNPVSIMRGHTDRMPGWPQGIPADLRDVLAACLDKSPRQRPAAHEVSIRLRQLTSGYTALSALTPLASPPIGPPIGITDARTTLEPTDLTATAAFQTSNFEDPGALSDTVITGISSPSLGEPSKPSPSVLLEPVARPDRSKLTAKHAAVGAAIAAVLLIGGGTAYTVFSAQPTGVVPGSTSAVGPTNPPPDESPTSSSAGPATSPSAVSSNIPATATPPSSSATQPTTSAAAPSQSAMTGSPDVETAPALKNARFDAIGANGTIDTRGVTFFDSSKGFDFTTPKGTINCILGPRAMLECDAMNNNWSDIISHSATNDGQRLLGWGIQTAPAGLYESNGGLNAREATSENSTNPWWRTGMATHNEGGVTYIALGYNQGIRFDGGMCVERNEGVYCTYQGSAFFVSNRRYATYGPVTDAGKLG